MMKPVNVFITLLLSLFSSIAWGQDYNCTVYYCSGCVKAGLCPVSQTFATRDEALRSAKMACPGATPNIRCTQVSPSANNLSNKSLTDDAEAASKKAEAHKKVREEAEAKKKKEEDENREKEKEDALKRMKGTSLKEFGLKGTRISDVPIKRSNTETFGFKSTGQTGANENRIKVSFLKIIQEDSTNYKSQLQKIMNEVDKIYVPSPKILKPKIIHEGIILGLYNTQKINSVKQVRSPFTGKEYKEGEFFATSDALSANELLRGVIDNSYLGEYTLNTEWGKQLITELKETHFNRLIAHSNGATVSESLIRKGIITVDELNVIGGDRSLINYYGLNELITSGKVKRVIVWINPGDVIPYGSSAGLFSPAVGARDQYITSASDYFTLKLTGQGKGGDAKVEYRFLKGPQYGHIGQEFVFTKDEFFNAHGIDAYFANMKTYFKTH